MSSTFLIQALKSSFYPLNIASDCYFLFHIFTHWSLELPYLCAEMLLLLLTGFICIQRTPQNLPTCLCWRQACSYRYVPEQEMGRIYHLNYHHQYMAKAHKRDHYTATTNQNTIGYICHMPALSPIKVKMFKQKCPEKWNDVLCLVLVHRRAHMHTHAHTHTHTHTQFACTKFVGGTTENQENR